MIQNKALSSPIKESAQEIDGFIISEGSTFGFHVVSKGKLLLEMIGQSQEIAQEAVITGMKVIPRFVAPRQTPFYIMDMAGRAKGYAVLSIGYSFFKKSSRGATVIRVTHQCGLRELEGRWGNQFYAVYGLGYCCDQGRAPVAAYQLWL